MSDKVKTIGDQLVNFTVKEVKELATYLNKTYGIEPAGSVAQYVPPGTGDFTPERSTFDIVLKSAGVNKLQVVKLVKDILGYGLKESKDLVDGAPRVIKAGIQKNEAENIKNQLSNIGADVEVR